MVMKGKLNIEKIIRISLVIVAVVCIIISMFQEENSILLKIGLICICIERLLYVFLNKDK
jgi:hypothetical protein